MTEKIFAGCDKCIYWDTEENYCLVDARCVDYCEYIESDDGYD